MSRKETSNTWQDGLVMDLNPMNTPNTVLTDNLNGTIITYNGNEHLLQNDQGNFKLKYCKLNPNFVPVGLKEYGDILYIVSYNPITEETEIGSYPSPMIVTESTLIQNQSAENFAIDKILQEKDYFKYSETDSYNYNYVFATDNLKLNPGDRFQLQRELYGLKIPIYEGIEYKILDSDKKLHDISNSIEDYLKNDGGESNVMWDIPGWLCVNSRIADFDSFSTTITKFTSVDDKVTIEYKFQLNIDDPILISKYKGKSEISDPGFYLDLIDIRLKQRISDLPENTVTLSSSKTDEYHIDWIEKDWYDGNKIIQATFKNSFTLNQNSTDRSVSLEIVPILRDIFNEREYSIEYEHLTEKISADFDNFVSVGNSNLLFGDSIYQFWRDGSDVNLNYNVRINAENQNDVPVESDIKLYAKAFTLDGNAVTNHFVEVSDGDILIYQKNDVSESRNTCYLNALQLSNEMIYEVLFVINGEDPDENSNDLSKTITSLENSKINYFKKILITSTIFERYLNSDSDSNSHSDFEKIPMNTWVNDYINEYFNRGEIIISNVFSKKSGEPITTWENKDETYWNQKGLIASSSKDPEKIIISQEYDVEFTFENTQEEFLDKYRIGMWKELISYPEYYLEGLKHKDGKEYEESVKVIPSKVTSSYEGYDENIGDWDVDTANISGNKISYNNFVYGSKNIIFNRFETYFKNLPLTYRTSDPINIIERSFLIKFYKYFTYQDASGSGWVYQWNKGNNTYDKGYMYGDYIDKKTVQIIWSEIDKELSSYNYDVVLVKMQVGTANDVKWMLGEGEGSWTWTTANGGDLVRFGYGSDNLTDENKWYGEQFWADKDYGEGALSEVWYFLMFRGETKPIFFNTGVNSQSELRQIFDNCIKVTGSNINNYYAFIPNWEINLEENKNLGCSINSKLNYNKNWIINNIDLFNINNVPVLDWSGELLKLENVTEDVEENSEFKFESEEINKDLDLITNHIKNVDSDYNLYYINDSFIGLRGGDSNNSSLNHIKLNSRLDSNSKLKWIGTSSQVLSVGSTDSSKRLHFGLGYYIQ